MGQVIIHAGFHKTATTSIQKTFAENCKQLEKLGFYYPLFYLDDRLIDNHSMPFSSLFMSNPEQYHMNARWKVDANEANQQYKQQLNGILHKKLNKILISGEDISMLTRSELSRMIEKIYSYAVGRITRQGNVTFDTTYNYQSTLGFLEVIQGGVNGAKYPKYIGFPLTTIVSDSNIFHVTFQRPTSVSDRDVNFLIKLTMG